MAFPALTPIPVAPTKPDADAGLWNSRYLEIDANFNILEDADLSTFWDGDAFSVPGGIVAGNGHVIEDEGTPLAQKSTMNFIGPAVGAASGATKTDVTINGAVWGKNIEALSANKTLTDASEPIQVLTPDAARDVIAPAEAVTNPLFIIQNPSGSGFDLTFKDDGLSTIDTIADGETKIFFSDGVAWDVLPVGSGDMLASTYDPASISEQLAGLTATQTFTNKTHTDPILNGDLSGTAFLDEDDMVSDSATKVPSQQSVKKYVDDVILPLGFAASDEDTDLTTGLAKLTMRMPHAMTLTEVRSNLKTAPTGADLIVDINENGTSILSTKLAIDATEKTSTTATTPAVISGPNLADDAEITVDIDQIGSTIAGTGLKLWLIGKKA